jgi:transcriptional regulator with GAF, ATPase, and Fis domain
MLDREMEVEPGTGEDRPSLLRDSFDTPVRESLPSNLNSPMDTPLPGMVGSSRAMIPVYRAARLLARRDTTVLLSGPTGSGKELVARAIHALSARASRSLVVVNSAAIPEALLESELFGHVRGAFTGAMQSYGGRIQSAQGGTLLLDEIGDMPLSLQPKLLRFLEQKEIQRLGSCDTVRVDTRVIAATNVHLPALVASGKFREDLYYRLSAFPIDIPPLRERPEDIVALTRHLLEKFVSRPPAPQLGAETIRLLKSHSWPGNVRELQNVLERALILAEDTPILEPDHLLLHKPSFVT